MVVPPNAKNVEPLGNQPPNPAQAPRPLTDSLFDFPDMVSLRQSYIIASTPRCGSTLLSTVLWQTGVLGAPAEYWSYHKRAAAKTIGTRMMERLQVLSRADYLTKLIACRTSRNGIFGVKVHYNDFKEAVSSFPDILDRIAPTKFVHIERSDRVAQAVSMARALQTGKYTSSWKAPASSTHLQYDEGLISHLITQLTDQNEAWLRWFEEHDIEPLSITYEQLAADKEAVARNVIEWLGAEEDEPQEVRLRNLEKQSDGLNKQWIARYKESLEGPASRRTESRQAGSEQDDAAETGVQDETSDSHIFDRFDLAKRVAKNQTTRKPSYLGGLRLRRRYEAIVARNRQLFEGARVLNIECGDGRWCLAAIEAGAGHVTGLDHRRAPIDTAQKIFSQCGVPSERYEFINAATISGIRDFDAGRFDLILCQETAELPDPYLFFSQLHRLGPKHVILDTALNSRPQAVAMFKPHYRTLGPDKPTADLVRGKFVSMTCIPNHELITSLAAHFDFACCPVDWQTFGITNWAGLGDYENSRRGTYVLDAA